MVGLLVPHHPQKTSNNDDDDADKENVCFIRMAVFGSIRFEFITKTHALRSATIDFCVVDARTLFDVQLFLLPPHSLSFTFHFVFAAKINVDHNRIEYSI